MNALKVKARLNVGTKKEVVPEVGTEKETPQFLIIAVITGVTVIYRVTQTATAVSLQFVAASSVNPYTKDNDWMERTQVDKMYSALRFALKAECGKPIYLIERNDNA